MGKDLRSWLEVLEKAGSLARITKDVDPESEVAALLWQAGDKALLFGSITGHPGWRGIGQTVPTRRHVAMAIGVDEDQLSSAYARRMQERVDPVEVSTGPVKEIVSLGDDVDLTSLPAHMSGYLDAGRYITSGLCITADPDSGRRNLSYHRLQVRGRNRTGVLMVPRDAMRNYQKYEARGEPMPMAVVIGHHPALYLAGAAPLAYGDDELALAGALLQEPVEMVGCESIGLNVPAKAEIVIEGHVLPSVREAEGPFGEFQGYYLSGAGENPVFEASCVTRRADSVYMFLQNELEGNLYCDVNYAVVARRAAEGVGRGADIRNVAMLPGLFGVVIQMVPRFHGEAKGVLMGAMSSALLNVKTAIAVDDDVDPFNTNDVLWSIDTRVNPSDDIVVIPGARVHPMDVSGREMTPPGTELWHRVGSRVLIDATKPPLADPVRREEFTRIHPPGWNQVSLRSFLDVADR